MSIRPLLAILMASVIALACVPMYMPQQQQSYQGSHPPARDGSNTGYQNPTSTASQNTYVPDQGQNAIRDLEIAVWQQVNQQRSQYGLAPLSWEDPLASIARSHSQDMLSRNYFSHTTPEGSGTFDIIQQQYSGRWRNMGENIITSSGRTLSDINAMASFLVNQWMQSPGHRQNILTPDFTHTGIGFAMQGAEIRGTQCFVRLAY